MSLSRIKFAFVIFVITLSSVVAAIATTASSKGELNVYLALIESAPDLDATPTATIPSSTNTPTATTTTAPPTSTPTATATSIPQTCTILEDDFSDPTSGWGSGSSTSEEHGYDNGEFRILNKQPSGFSVRNMTVDYRTGNLSVSVDTRWESTIGNWHGVIVRSPLVDGGVQYSVKLITIAQLYSVEYFDLNTGMQTVISPTFSAEINPNNETNRLTVSKTGGVATIYVNGVEIDNFEIQEERYAMFLSSSAVSGYGTYPAATRFDNFCLSD